MLANALATAAALGVAPRLFPGFVDAAVPRLLGIDGAREVALALLSVGPETPPAASASPPAPIEHATLPLSRHVVDEPLVAQAHAASALATPEDVVRWRAGRAPVPPPAGARLIALPPPDPRAGRALGETIQRRRSTPCWRPSASAAIGS